MKVSHFLQTYRAVVSSLLLITGIVVYLFGSVLTEHALKTHDTLDMYFRIVEYVQEMETHGFPPTLFPNAMQGGGFAFPIFYPPFSYLVASGLSDITDTCYLAGNIALFLSVLTSAYAAFYAFLKIGSRLSTALAASILYVTIPYRFVEIFARGALAEAWTFPWLPLVFCGGILILKGRNRQGFVMLALSTCGLLLSHAVMGVYFMLICTTLFLVTCLAARRFRALGYAVLAMVFAAGLGAWYMVPQRMHWDLVEASEEGAIGAKLKYVKRHNVEFAQLFYTDSERWSGDSAWGPGDQMSFELGYANFLLLFILGAGYFWFRGRRVPQPRTETILRVGSIVVWIITIWFTCKSQRFLKHLPEQLFYIQFAWRMMGITAFFCVASYVLVLNRYRLSFRMRSLVAFLAIGGSIATVNPAWRVPQYNLNAPEEPLTPDVVKVHGGKGFVMDSEYRPRGYDPAYNFVIAEGDAIAFGNMDITSQDTTATEAMVYGVDARTSSIICLPLLAYPVYEARTESGMLEPFSHFGFQAFSGVQPGDQTVTVYRVLSEPQKLGLAISGISIVLFGLCLLMPVWTNGKRINEKG